MADAFLRKTAKEENKYCKFLSTDFARPMAEQGRKSGKDLYEIAKNGQKRPILFIITTKSAARSK